MKIQNIKSGSYVLLEHVLDNPLADGRKKGWPYWASLPKGKKFQVSVERDSNQDMIEHLRSHLPEGQDFSEEEEKNMQFLRISVTCEGSYSSLQGKFSLQGENLQPESASSILTENILRNLDLGSRLFWKVENGSVVCEQTSKKIEVPHEELAQALADLFNGKEVSYIKMLAEDFANS